MGLFRIGNNVIQGAAKVEVGMDDINHLVFEHMSKIRIPEVLCAADGNVNYGWLWAYADLKGKALYGKDFRMYPEDAAIMLQIMTWFMQDPLAAAQYKVRLEAGICLLGPVGCGKTGMLRIASHLPYVKIKPLFKACSEISLETAAEGPATLLHFTKHSFDHSTGKPKTWLFDDLGVEPNANFYGTAIMPMKEILMARSNYYTSHRMRTMLTTNLNSDEIETIYGTRVRSKLREMVNFIAFPADAKDKRE